MNWPILNTIINLMEFPSIINSTSPFPFYGMFDGIFHFYSFYIENSVSKR